MGDKFRKESKTIRWGIIGCGDVTEVKSGPAYQKTEGFSLVAVMRRDAEKSADYARRHGVEKHYSDADSLINDPDIDAVYIATPPDMHKYYAIKVAQAGKICCIEKPMAPNYEDSLAIYDAFENRNIPLFVSYYRRSLARFIQVKKWLDTDKIGAIRHINWNLTKPASEFDMSKEYNWRTDAKIAKAGYFDDLASHGLDLFAYLIGDFKEASGFSVDQQELYSAKDAVVACWVHEFGITGTGNWNFVSSERNDVVTITGNKGKITFSVFDENPIELSSEFENIVLEIPHPENVQLFHVENMREHLLGNSKHPSTGKSALHTSWVMDKITGWF